jgi:hypothetical protein
LEYYKIESTMRKPTPRWIAYLLFLAFVIMVVLNTRALSTERKERIKSDAITTIQYDSIMKMEGKILNKLTGNNVNGATKRIKGF